MNSNRRTFLKTSIIMTAGVTTVTNSSFNIITGQQQKDYVGHGDFKYKVDKEWGIQDPAKFPVKDCHEMVQDSKGRLILLTNHTQNNVLIYDRSGKIIGSWGKDFPGAHGLTLWEAGGEEFLFITDQDRHQVFKTTMDGKILMTLDYPKETGVYENADQYKPTETTIASDNIKD